MKQIEIQVHLAEGQQPKAIKIAEDATIEQLLKEIQAAGAAIGEPGEEIILWVENKEVACRRHHKLHECGIKDGHRIQCHPRDLVIIVNTREKKWGKWDISYDEVVILAFGSISSDPNVVYTVTFSKGPEPKRDGSLVKGRSVKVKCGMILNVTQTNKS
jgi:hypothetical protein